MKAEKKKERIKLLLWNISKIKLFKIQSTGHVYIINKIEENYSFVTYTVIF